MTTSYGDNPFDSSAAPASTSRGLEGQKASPRSDIDFVTMGMVILDDIDFGPSKPLARNVLGGAGAYAALGARLFSPSSLSSSIAWVIDQGCDFPAEMTALINTWTTTAIIRSDGSRLTTRGWNGYLDRSGTRSFRYLTPKKRITAIDLDPDLMMSRSFHLICSPTRCRELVTEILARRRNAAGPDDRACKPIFVWEPLPDSCTPKQLSDFVQTLHLVDVFSPNHHELSRLVSCEVAEPDGRKVVADDVENACRWLFANIPVPSCALVIRVGEHGCFVAKKGAKSKHNGKEPVASDARTTFPTLCSLPSGEDGIELIEDSVDTVHKRWMPAYHESQNNVVDPTGGGNAYLGGLTVAMARGATVFEAAAFGSVAASFAIEQIGLPQISTHEDGSEAWKGVSVRGRLREFQSRL